MEVKNEIIEEEEENEKDESINEEQKEEEKEEEIEEEAKKDGMIESKPDEIIIEKGKLTEDIDINKNVQNESQNNYNFYEDYYPYKKS